MVALALSGYPAIRLYKIPDLSFVFIIDQGQYLLLMKNKLGCFLIGLWRGENLSVVLSRIYGIFGAGLSMAMKSGIVTGIEHWEAFFKGGIA